MKNVLPTLQIIKNNLKIIFRDMPRSEMGLASKITWRQLRLDQVTIISVLNYFTVERG